MIKKPERSKKLHNQDRQLPATIQDLINRYDLDNEKVYEFLDYLVENTNSINDNKYDKTGGMIKGDVEVEGNVKAEKFNGDLVGNAETASYSTLSNRAWAMKAYHSGSNLANTQGWYKIGSVTLANYNDLSATLLITHEYARGDFGLLKIKCRKDTGDIYFQSFKWGVRYGFGEGQAIAVVSGGSATFYIYNSVPQYGRIGVTVLENSSRGGNGGLVLYESTAPESSTPTATVKATDINVTGANLYNNSSGTDGTITLTESSANFSYLEVFGYKGSGDEYTSIYGKIHSPNGKKMTLSTMLPDDIQMYTYSEIINISGTSLTRVKGTGWSTEWGGWNTFKTIITRVVGYR